MYAKMPFVVCCCVCPSASAAAAAVQSIRKLQLELKPSLPAQMSIVARLADQSPHPARWWRCWVALCRLSGRPWTPEKRMPNVTNKIWGALRIIRAALRCAVSPHTRTVLGIVVFVFLLLFVSLCSSSSNSGSCLNLDDDRRHRCRCCE